MVVKVTKILDEMDVKSPQVALSTVIGELTLNEDEQFGVNYFGRHHTNAGNGALTVNNNPSVLPFAGGSTPGASPGTTSGGSIFDPANLLSFTALATAAQPGTNVFLAAGNTLAAVVHALDSTNKFRTISRPTVFTSNNKKAIIASGQEIPIPVNTISQPTTVAGVIPSTSFANSSSIEFKKIALQLEVVPLINSEREVTLDILQKIDSVAGQTNVNGNNIPTIATRYIKTSVSAPNCSTIVLGGLIMDDKGRNASGIPVLGRIPLIGAIFRSTERKKDRTELIILMRPEVALTKLDLKRLREKNEDKTHFGPEIDQDDCPDCPTNLPTEDKQIVLPNPDLPGMK
ncbi:MAG TPA: hypothetical protein VE086_09870 [Chthoniobacterales bacterium]|nr:hypothetical protein [Chthoniobacterales bacterium]